MNIDRIPPDIHFNENGEIVWTPRLIDFNARAYTRGHTVTADEFNTELIKQTYQGNYNTDTINILTKLYSTVNRNSIVALEKATTAESDSKQALENVNNVLEDVENIVERADTALERAEEALDNLDSYATDEDITNALKDYYTKQEVDTAISNVEVDLSEYYTITEVDNLIKNVKVDLSDYYTKSETYSRTEIDNKISLIPKFSIKVVTALPTENISDTTVYLVKDYGVTSNLYTEYIYVEGAWETLGVQNVDLSNYLPLTGGTITGPLINTDRRGFVYKSSQMNAAVSVQSGDGNMYAVIQGSFTDALRFGTPFGKTVFHGSDTRPYYTQSLGTTDLKEIALLSDVSGGKITWREWTR